MTFHINQVFEGEYPPEAALWCNTRGDCSIQQVDGGYQIIQNPEPDDSMVAEAIRNKRDNLIGETDYYLMPDYPSNPQNLEELKVYRQALRDIPKQGGFPRDVRWPDVPKFLCKDSEWEPLGLAKVGI
jgi:hypothetical protein